MLGRGRHRHPNTPRDCSGVRMECQLVRLKDRGMPRHNRHPMGERIPASRRTPWEDSWWQSHLNTSSASNDTAAGNRKGPSKGGEDLVHVVLVDPAKMPYPERLPGERALSTCQNDALPAQHLQQT